MCWWCNTLTYKPYLVHMLVPPSLQSKHKHLDVHIYHHSCTWVRILLYTRTSIQMIACMIITCITLTLFASPSMPTWLTLTRIWAYTTSMITTVTITLCYERIIAEHCDAQNTDNTFLAVLSFPSFNTLTVIWSHTGSPIHASRRTVSWRQNEKHLAMHAEMTIPIPIPWQSGGVPT